MAEQFALEQFGRNRPAVDRDEGLFCPRRGGVHTARDDFLSGTGLTGDQHCRRRGRNPLDLAAQTSHLGAAANQFSCDQAPRRAFRRAFPPKPPGRLEHAHDVGEFQRRGQGSEYLIAKCAGDIRLRRRSDQADGGGAITGNGLHQHGGLFLRIVTGEQQIAGFFTARPVHAPCTAAQHRCKRQKRGRTTGIAIRDTDGEHRFLRYHL